MKNGFYENRKEQMQSFARRFKHGKVSLVEVLKDACICGASEERFRCLQILRGIPNSGNNSGILTAEDGISAESIESVLGYRKSLPKKTDLPHEKS